MKSDKRSTLRIFNIITFFLLAFLIWRVLELRSKYMDATRARESYFQKNGVSYRVIHSTTSSAIMLLGDLTGINQLSSELLKNGLSIKDFSGKQIIVISLYPAPYRHITEENFLAAVSTKDGIFLPDNFCTKGWGRLKEKEIYQNTSLSPGPYCFSEPQTLLINNLLRQYNISKVMIYYDTKGYIELIRNFLNYLEELNIEYELVNSPEI